MLSAPTSGYRDAPAAGGEDYIFPPHYTNRATAARIFARRSNILPDETGLNHDPVTDSERSLYDLHHTAICMRIVLSHGKVNIFNLAKNAGTSVEQIERLYAKHLPLSREMAMKTKADIDRVGTLIRIRVFTDVRFRGPSRRRPRLKTGRLRP